MASSAPSGSAKTESPDMADTPFEDSKRRRIERGKKACLPCRSRKCKCGGAPPEPCPNCVGDAIECQWPTEDGRSSQARKDRARARRLQSMAVRGLGRPMSKADREAATPLFPDSAGPSWPMMPLEGEGIRALAGPGEPGADLSLAHLDSIFDPEQFILAMSSQLPTVEEGSDASPATLLLPNANAHPPDEGEARVVKITWWRPHGPTAIAPGLKRLSLKVRVEPPRTHPSYPSPGVLGTGEDLFRADGMPSAPVMRHLLDIFAERFGCQFPVLNHACLVRELEEGRGSVFLFNCVAATAARFATHPAIAKPGLKPHEYGNVFAARAKGLLASMLAVPSRDTVVALVLMAHVGFGNDSESEEWMFTGMAVRMAIDLGLHLEPADYNQIEVEEQRLDCLAFWSVLLMDYALSFGTGRQTTFRIEEITRRLPTQDDIPGQGGTRSPFPYAARQMLAYGPLINLLNGPDDPPEVEGEIVACRAVAVQEYNALPSDMQWSATNLQLHKMAHHDSIFLHIHLWMHTVIASAYLTSGEYRRHKPKSSGASGHATPTVSAASANVWRNSARTIGDMLVLSDVIDPFAYLALPFANQSFYVAGCCYIKEIEQHGPEGSGSEAGGGGQAQGQVDLFRSMLASVATTSISTLQAGLARQATYWAGVAWVGGTLAQRVAGIHADQVDLAQVNEQLQTYVSMPDAGLVDKRGKAEATGPLDFSNLDLLTLPFDLASYSGLEDSM